MIFSEIIFMEYISEFLGSKSESSCKLAENIILFFANHFGDDELLLRNVICLGVPPSVGRIKTCENP